jgi:hypothetical protein
VAIILDASLTDVPDRYREAENARKLVSVVCDAASHGGIVVAPISEREIHEYARSQGCRLALFSLDECDVAPEAHGAAASLFGDRIHIVRAGGAAIDGGAIRANAPIVAQVAAALGAAVLEHARVT